MAKKKSSSDEVDGNDVQNQSLEESMTELASIVSRLESGQETLDESLAQFERGMKLLRTCHSKLDVAAQRIEIVTQMSPDGDVKTADFDAAATLQKPSSEKPAPASRPSRKLLADEDDDDALLF